ncbi:hypothetical protein [Pseudomonas coronafaciens]|uniref:hypothetical protein n=1 Tax=Pseudomonas coronafaciens TaxID=53409 RepID=UPI0011C48050|nr:hypothetical protein [Pseudomonas coronafaciens]
MKDRIFKIGKFRIARQFDGYVLISFVFVAHASFTMLANQCIESGARLYTLLNNLLDQVLLKLPILAVKVIAFIARQYAGSVFYIGTYMLSRRRKVILIIDILLKSFQMLFRLRII